MGVLSAVSVLVAGVVAAAPAIAAKGYVMAPYWAALTASGRVELAYSPVESSSLGTMGGPKGSTTQVPTGVRLVSAKGTRTVLTAPKGWAILQVAASESGVVAVAVPVAVLASTAPVKAEPWQVLVSNLAGPAHVAWRFTPAGQAHEAAPAVAATGAHWVALTTGNPGGTVPTESLLAEGGFAAGRVTTVEAKASLLPTGIAVEPNGAVGVFGLIAAGKTASLPRYPASAHVGVIWTGHGVLVPAPGGFLTIINGAVAKPESGGRSVLIGKIPKGDGVVSMSGDGRGVVFLLANRKGRLTTWAIGSVPKNLKAVLSLRPSAVVLTAAGLVGVNLHVTHRVVTVSVAAAIF